MTLSVIPKFKNDHPLILFFISSLIFGSFKTTPSMYFSKNIFLDELVFILSRISNFL